MRCSYTRGGPESSAQGMPQVTETRRLDGPVHAAESGIEHGHKIGETEYCTSGRRTEASRRRGSARGARRGPGSRGINAQGMRELVDIECLLACPCQVDDPPPGRWVTQGPAGVGRVAARPGTGPGANAQGIQHLTETKRFDGNVHAEDKGVEDSGMMRGSGLPHFRPTHRSLEAEGVRPRRPAAAHGPRDQCAGDARTHWDCMTSGLRLPAEHPSRSLDNSMSRGRAGRAAPRPGLPRVGIAGDRVTH